MPIDDQAFDSAGHETERPTGEVTITDDEIRTALGSCSQPNFEDWQRRHGEAVAYLNPIVTRMQTRRRRLVMRLIQISATSALLACLALLFTLGGESSAYADAIKSLQAAKTISWDHDFYLRATSVDGERTWLHKMSTRRHYQHPGKHRTEYPDANGDPAVVRIQDLIQGKVLEVDYRDRTARAWNIDPAPEDRGPFLSKLASLGRDGLELLGERASASGPVLVFRRTLDRRTMPEPIIHDYWISKSTKELVLFRHSIERPFDPETDPDRDNPAEAKWKGTRALGYTESNINLSANLPDDAFSLTPPAGFDVTVIGRPETSEAEVLAFLKAAAELNDGQLPDSLRGVVFDQEKYRVAATKEEAERTEIERRILQIVTAAQRRTIFSITENFIETQTEPETFRYIGKGVRLGDADRLIAWYRVKNGTNYRAIYANCTAHNIDPTTLPLPTGQ